MNDFPELENELRALRPARPSPVLFERIEEAMVENCRASAAADAGWLAKWFRRFAEWSRGDASDIDGQLVRARERGRTSQTRYKSRASSRAFSRNNSPARFICSFS